MACAGKFASRVFCSEPSDIEAYSPLTDESGNTYHLALVGAIKNGFAARIVEVATKEDADGLKGTQLYADRDQLPSLPDDEFYHTDLIGLSVSDAGGTSVGTVKAVHNHGADDLLEITKAGSSATVLVPFTQAIVPTVDLEAGRIVIDPPDGLL